MDHEGVEIVGIVYDVVPNVAEIEDITFVVESLVVSLGVVAFNLSANVVSAAVVATVTTRFLKTSYANVFLQFFMIQLPLNNYLNVTFSVS